MIRSDSDMSEVGTFQLMKQGNLRMEIPFTETLARTPHESSYVNFMNKHCLHWTYNTVRVQEEGSSVCGLHCIFYLIHVQDIA